MICVNKIVAVLCLSILFHPLWANDQVKDWETAWEKELLAYYGLSLADSLELAKKRLSLRVIPEDRENPPADEKETQEFYSAYFRSQRFRPYTAMLILPDQRLPGDFKKRPLEKETLLIVNANTTKESLLHLILHLVTDKKESLELAQKIQNLRKEKSSESTAKEIRELQLKILNLDSEAEKDLFILSKQKEFEIPEAEKTQLLNRVERNLKRLETELKPHLEQKEKSLEGIDLAQQKIKRISEALSQYKALK